jgi:FAD synthase
LREERRFDGIDALREQIARDMLQARAVLASRASERDEL